MSRFNVDIYSVRVGKLKELPPDGIFFQEGGGRAICLALGWEWGWGIGLKKTDWSLFGSDCGEGAGELPWNEQKVYSAEVRTQEGHTH